MVNFYNLSEAVRFQQENLLVLDPQTLKMGDQVFARTSLPQHDVAQGAQGKLIGIGENTEDQMLSLRFRFPAGDFSLPADEAQDVFMIYRPIEE